MNASVYRLRSRTARFALAVLVLLATQVALSHGLCRAVMLDSGHPLNLVAATGEHDNIGSPCCDDMARHVDCRSSPMDATIGTRPLAKSSVLANATPLAAYVPAILTRAQRAPRAPPDARAAPSLPVHLRFGRFLS